MEHKDYYKILGVTRQASPDVIRTAYRRLARRYHPDVSSEPGAEARFKEIAEAYDALRDPQRRAAYDRRSQAQASTRRTSQPRTGQASARPSPERRERARAESEDNPSFADFLQNLFGNRSSSRRGKDANGEAATERRQRAPGADQQATVTISLEEAYRGGNREVTVQAPNANSSNTRSRTLRVKIPAGVLPGQQIRLAGQGGPGLGGGSRGDFYLKVEIAPHRLFQLEGRDIHLELPIAPWEAALGTSVQVPTLGGPVELRVPADSRSGRRLRLKGRGLPGEPPGDQYVQLQIVTPPADHPELRRLYEQLRRFSQFDPRADFG